MRVRPKLDPDVDDEAPTGPDITIYDKEHFVTYLRLLDAVTDGADWKWRRSFSIAVRSRRKPAHAIAGRAISPARNG